ncbi:hypothetical protein [Microbispora sp. NBC_01389]|uniref:hypothetical protein n=1 Tax=Microbispora sp. NBC_01389 TaxID=2903584 RepID=UPI003246041E
MDEHARSNLTSWASYGYCRSHSLGRRMSLIELRDVLIHPSCSNPARDSVWRLLVTRARHNGPQWIVIAAGIAVPALRGISGRICRGYVAGDPEDIDTEVLTGYDVLAMVEITPFVESFLVLIVMPLAAAVTCGHSRPHSAGQVAEGVTAGTMTPLMMATLAVIIGSRIAAVGPQVVVLAQMIPPLPLVALAVAAYRLAGRATRVPAAAEAVGRPYRSRPLSDRGCAAAT